MIFSIFSVWELSLSELIARAINEKYHLLLETASTMGGQEDKAQWEILLRSLSAWRSFNWLKTGRLKPNEISDFLIFDKRIPRSISFCYRELNENLNDLAITYDKSYDSSKLSNKLLSDLMYHLLQMCIQ